MTEEGKIHKISNLLKIKGRKNFSEFIIPDGTKKTDRAKLIDSWYQVALRMEIQGIQGKFLVPVLLDSFKDLKTKIISKEPFDKELEIFLETCGRYENLGNVLETFLTSGRSDQDWKNLIENIGFIASLPEFD